MSEAKQQTIEPAKGMPQPKTVAPAPLDKPVWDCLLYTSDAADEL